MATHTPNQECSSAKSWLGNHYNIAEACWRSLVQHETAALSRENSKELQHASGIPNSGFEVYGLLRVVFGPPCHFQDLLVVTLGPKKCQSLEINGVRSCSDPETKLVDSISLEKDQAEQFVSCLATSTSLAASVISFPGREVPSAFLQGHDPPWEHQFLKPCSVISTAGTP